MAFDPAFFVLGLSVSPYTLPNGVEPLIVANFKNAVYLIEGASAAITDIFEEDTDFGAYDPSDVVEGVGLVASFPVLKAALAAGPLSEGHTIIMEAVWSPGASNSFYAVDLPGFDQELYGGLDTVNDTDFKAFINGVHGGQSGPANLVAGQHKIGASIEGTDIHMSVDGSAVIAVTPGTPSTLNAIAIYANNAEITPIELWALYPFQDPSSLDELTAL